MDGARKSIHKNHCHAITGHGANHGIGAALKEIILLGHVHMSLRAEPPQAPGKVAENHWFGVLALLDREREHWVKKYDLCSISGDNVIVLPLESSTLEAYKAEVTNKAFPEDLDHEG